MKKYIKNKIKSIDDNPYAGFIYAVCSQILFSFVGLILKYTSIHAF